MSNLGNHKNKAPWSTDRKAKKSEYVKYMEWCIWVKLNAIGFGPTFLCMVAISMLQSCIVVSGEEAAGLDMLGGLRCSILHLSRRKLPRFQKQSCATTCSWVSDASALGGLGVAAQGGNGRIGCFMFYFFRSTKSMSKLARLLGSLHSQTSCHCGQLFWVGFAFPHPSWLRASNQIFERKWNHSLELVKFSYPSQIPLSGNQNSFRNRGRCWLRS